MSLRISRNFSFSASHVLAGLPSDHKCTRLHGHTYRVWVMLAGDVDEMGFVIDYGELDWVGEFINIRIDHRHLNDVLELNPTAENIALWLAEHISTWLRSRPEQARIHELSVGVSENSETRAVYTTALRR